MYHFFSAVGDAMFYEDVPLLVALMVITVSIASWMARISALTRRPPVASRTPPGSGGRVPVTHTGTDDSR